MPLMYLFNHHHFPSFYVVLITDENYFSNKVIAKSAGGKYIMIKTVVDSKVDGEVESYEQLKNNQIEMRHKVLE